MDKSLVEVRQPWPQLFASVAFGVSSIVLLVLGIAKSIWVLVVAAPFLAVLAWRQWTVAFRADVSGVRVRNLLSQGDYAWDDILGFRVRTLAAGWSSPAFLGFPGSAIEVLFRSGRVVTAVATQCVAGQDTTGRGAEATTEVWLRQLEALHRTVLSSGPGSRRTA